MFQLKEKKKKKISIKIISQCVENYECVRISVADFYLFIFYVFFSPAIIVITRMKWWYFIMIIGPSSSLLSIWMDFCFAFVIFWFVDTQQTTICQMWLSCYLWWWWADLFTIMIIMMIMIIMAIAFRIVRVNRIYCFKMMSSMFELYI